MIAFLMAVMLLLSAFPAYGAQKNEMNILLSSANREISPTLYGISLQDNALGIEAGLSAQMVCNNSFEYKNNAEYAWEFEGVEHSLSTKSPMNKSNTIYETLTVKGNGIVRNLGYVAPIDDDGKYSQSGVQEPGIYFEKDKTYEFSCYFMNIDFDGNLSVYLDSKQGKGDTASIDVASLKKNKWTCVNLKLTASHSGRGSLVLKLGGKGSICVDSFSLVSTDSYGFGEEEWKNSTLNENVVQALKELKPSFIAFPGATALSRKNDSTLISWKDTIGANEGRAQALSVFDDYSAGVCMNNSSFVGYHEYFQLCEDLGAAPVVQVGAGIASQSTDEYEAYLQALNKTYMTDEQFAAYLIEQYGYKKSEIKDRVAYIESLGIKTKADFDSYISTVSLTPGTDEFINYAQDILDLIEYANGDSNQTYWGSIRKQNGSEKPFGMEYLQIGYENYGESYWRNFEALKDIINTKYPEIKIIASSGSYGEGEAFDTASNKINSLFMNCLINESLVGTKEIPLSVSSARFDSYFRNNAGVIAGYNSEAYKKGNANNIFNAVDTASYLIGIERNSDTVKMAYYTNALARSNTSTETQSLVWFDGENIGLTPEYYVQQIFANNVGNEYIQPSMSIANAAVSSGVTVDRDSQCVYIKLVNPTGKTEKLSINISGCERINAASVQSVSSPKKSASNTIEKQLVLPVEQDVEFSQTGIEYEIQPYSTSVIRVAYDDNEGKAFYSLAENMGTGEKKPMSVKMFILMVAVIFVAATVVTYLVYSKVVLKGRKFKFNFRKKDKKSKKTDE